MKLFTFCAALMMPCALHGQVSSGAQSTSAFELVITEIMADPEPSFGLPNAEYVEILNRSPQPVNLAGWTFFEGGNRILPDLTLLSGEYFIICANSDTLLFQPFGKVAGISTMSLTNGGEKVSIRNPLGQPVDSVTYSDTWYGNSFKKDGGWSLERIDTEFTCHQTANWSPSNNAQGGTPGSVNSVNGIYSDITPPILIRAFCPDSISVTLVFSEPLEPGSVSELQNYSFGNGLSAMSANISNPNNTYVNIILNSVLAKNITHTITVNQITDCAGNFIEDNSIARFGLTDSITDGVVINEILFNPLTGGYDFVELYHAGISLINVSSLKLASINLISGEYIKVAIITNEPWLLFPGEYLVLTEKPDVVANHYRSSFPFNFITMYDLPAMNADAGHIALLSGINIVDEVRYDEDQHFQLLENVKGVSLEKINPLRNGMEPTSWHSASPSVGFATPGLKNSQFVQKSSDLKFVSVYPEIFSPDHDGKDDVITFTVNAGEPGFIGNITIYNARGQVIYDNKKNHLLSTSDAFTWNGIDNSQLVATPGVYVALVEVFNLYGEVKKVKLPFVVATKL